jgi:hypothetical protein
MSDAGYKSAQRAAGLAPAIGTTAECQLQLKCPHCDFLAKVSFDAATAMGDERTTPAWTRRPSGTSSGTT